MRRYFNPDLFMVAPGALAWAISASYVAALAALCSPEFAFGGFLAAAIRGLAQLRKDLALTE